MIQSSNPSKTLPPLFWKSFLAVDVVSHIWATHQAMLFDVSFSITEISMGIGLPDFRWALQEWVGFVTKGNSRQGRGVVEKTGCELLNNQTPIYFMKGEWKEELVLLNAYNPQSNQHQKYFTMMYSMLCCQNQWSWGDYHEQYDTILHAVEEDDISRCSWTDWLDL